MRKFAAILMAFAAFQVAGLVCLHDASAQVQDGAKRRARPPKWDARVLRAFFEDAREQLVGEPVFNTPGAAPGQSIPGMTNQPGGNSGFAWSSLISRETLEDEVKKVVVPLKEDVKSQGDFTRGGFKNVQLHFSTLAIVFGVIHDYDADVRWKDEAGGLRDTIGRAGKNAKTSSVQVFNQSKRLVDDLETLVRGGKIETDAANPDSQWGQVVEFSQIMQRMELAAEKRIKPFIANGDEFRNNTDTVKHEAELLAVLAQVLKHESLEYTPDATFEGYANEFIEHAKSVAEAAESGDYEKARDAAGGIAKMCSQCHADYR